MANTYRAVIKGNTAQAVHAAQKRYFVVQGIITNGDAKTPAILLIEHRDSGAVVRWLGEGPNKPPFPDGALLFYNDAANPKDEHKKVWIAKHGWSVEDDLEGLDVKLDLVAEYDVGEAVIQVWEGGRYHRFRVELFQLRDGKPTVVWSEAVEEHAKEDAARVALIRANRIGIVTGLTFDRLRDAIRAQRAGIPHKKSWKVDDDLDGLAMIEKRVLAKYDFDEDTTVVVYEGGDRYKFWVDIVKRHKGRPLIVWSRAVSEPFKERAVRSAIISATQQGVPGLSVERLAQVFRERRKVIATTGWEEEHTLGDLQTFHPWSVSTLVPGLHGKPKYRYFDDFGDALAYARDRVRKGKRLREGGRAYFILSHTSNPDGVAAYRVFRAFLRAEQRPGYQHIIDKPEYVLVQEASGTMPDDPSKTRWKVNKAHSVEILSVETERARKNPFPRR